MCYYLNFLFQGQRVKREINLHLEICVYIRVRGIFISFHIVPAALYGCYVYLEEKRTVLDKVPM